MNEAWESIEIEQAVGEKTVDYSVRQKVQSSSEATPGKYMQEVQGASHLRLSHL